MDEGKSDCKFFFTYKPTGKRPPGSPRPSYDDNIKMIVNIQEIT